MMMMVVAHRVSSDQYMHRDDVITVKRSIFMDSSRVPKKRFQTRMGGGVGDNDHRGRRRRREKSDRHFLTANAFLPPHNIDTARLVHGSTRRSNVIKSGAKTEIEGDGEAGRKAQSSVDESGVRKMHVGFGGRRDGMHIIFGEETGSIDRFWFRGHN